MSKYGVFSGPYFAVFELNTEIYSLNLRIQSEYKKVRTRKYFVFGDFSRSDYNFSKRIISSTEYNLFIHETIMFRSWDIFNRSTNFQICEAVMSIGILRRDYIFEQWRISQWNLVNW